MRAHIVNACYGLIDYVAYPLTLLAVAPILLRHLGVSAYGIFAFSMAAVNAGSIIASGFGDANIQLIATARAERNITAIHQTIRCTLGIQLLLGAGVAALGLTLSPWLAARVSAAAPSELRICILALRIACVLVLLRTAETVAVSTQRAFEAYNEAVRVSAAFRVLSLIAAGALAWGAASLPAILLTIVVLSLLSTAIQLLRVAHRTSFACLVPSLHRRNLRALISFGGFTWLQAAAGAIAGQVDRIVIGVCMGSTAVAAYSFASQLAQPIAGSTASVFHFLFPHLAHRASETGVNAIRRPVAWAIACNIALVTLETMPLLLLGHWIMRHWAGQQIANDSARMLPLLILASGLTALSVTGNYAMLALGRVRTATWITLGSTCLMMAAAAVLTPRWGGAGMALARLGCGAGLLLVYVPLWRQLAPARNRVTAIPAAAAVERGAFP